MWSNDKNFLAKGFLTPPPTRKSKPPLYSPVVMPMSEMKKGSSPSNKGDLFHVIHKVPAGDSPYVRAKHVQLIDKDPSKAISLFWAAINSGDRVDSALKDMAVVMKQLNRTDEAIEAVKSFRHLCPHESQESLDNVLIELYKRSGKIEEEIEMLHLKLKHIEEGTTFGRKKTKTARSQGKKIYITIDQERSRILGNLAWAYLQLNDYKAAEELYRKALSLELDLNKLCNLALCLMHMDRIAEAKSMLQAVNDSSKGGQMDVSYAKSFESAIQMLNELELQSGQSPVTQEEKLKEIQISSTSPRNRNLKELANSVNGRRDKISILGVSRRLADGGAEEAVILNEQNRGTYCQSHFVKKDNFFRYGKGNSEGTLFQPRSSPHFSPQTSVVNKWTKGASHENWIGKRFAFANNRNENWAHEVDSCKKTYAPPVCAGGNLKIPLTEPRRHSCLVGIGDRSNGFWGIDEHRSSSRRLFYDQPMTVEDARALAPQNHIGDWRRSREDLSRPQNHNVDWRGPREELAGAKNEAVIKYFSHLTEDGNQKNFFCEDDVQTKSAVKDVKPGPKLSMGSPLAIDRARATETSIGGDWEQTSDLTVSGSGKMTSTDSGLGESITGNLKPTQNISTCETKKSWADMVEEEEQELVSTRADARINEGCYSFQESSFLDSWDSKGFNNENLDSNIIPQTPPKRVDSLSLKLESFDIHNGYGKSRSTISSRDRTARRALCFSQQQTILNFEDNNCVAAADQRESSFGKNITPMRRNRLQVFQDITCTSESP